MNKQGSGTLLISNGYRPVVRSTSAKVNSFSGSLVYDFRQDVSKEDHDGKYSDDEVDDKGEYWSGSGVEEIKWDAMFQNLKPT